MKYSTAATPKITDFKITYSIGQYPCIYLEWTGACDQSACMDSFSFSLVRDNMP